MAVVQDVFIRDGKFRTDVSRQEVERSIARNSTLSQADVQRATDTIMSKYQNFQQRLPEIKQKAEVTAQKTADVASKAAIWSFIALLLGLITAGFGGRSGEPVYRRDQFENEVI
jgi:topoisomerase IA-like protein